MAIQINTEAYVIFHGKSPQGANPTGWYFSDTSESFTLGKDFSYSTTRMKAIEWYKNKHDTNYGVLYVRG